MALGLFAPLPIRLGGSDTEGWTAFKHARMCADIVALKRTLPFAVWSYELVGDGLDLSIYNYYGQNGVGLDYAPTVNVVSGGASALDATFTWNVYGVSDPYDVSAPIQLRGAVVTKADSVPDNIGGYATDPYMVGTITCSVAGSVLTVHHENAGDHVALLASVAVW